MPIDAACMAGQSCQVGRGCVTGTSCTMDSQCDDSIPCTSDSCAVGNVCSHTPVNALCTAPQTCNATMGCVGPTGCNSAAECDDTIGCTVDACGADRRCTHTAVDAMCTMSGERCSTSRGCYTPRPCTNDDECQDDNVCNGREVCEPEFGCADAPVPANCSDTDVCTLNERCDATADMCTFDCDRTNAACATHVGCETTAPACSGRFTLSPGPSARCAFGMVTYNLSTITMTNTAGFITVMPSSSSFGSMSDTSGTACPSFTAVGGVPGACAETYTLTGTFTDDDHFTGMWTATFVDTEGVGACDNPFPPYGPLCPDQSIAVTGTRAP
jgi:hypothetical protein